MNLYDVLRLLIGKAGLSEVLANEALLVIDELEKWNALGTTTKSMDVEGHTHRYPPFSDVCDLCGRGRDS